MSPIDPPPPLSLSVVPVPEGNGNEQPAYIRFLKPGPNNTHEAVYFDTFACELPADLSCCQAHKPAALSFILLMETNTKTHLGPSVSLTR